MLPGLHEEMWDETAGRYKTKSGELGFPNEMARALVRAGTPVIALPIARAEESLGLRNRSGYEKSAESLRSAPRERGELLKAG